MRRKELHSMGRMRWSLWMLITASAVAIFLPTPAHAQDPPPSDQQPQPDQPSKPDDARPPKKPATKKNTDKATVSAPDQPTWDPLRAEKDLEVGKYYMRKGDVDAAIDRFQDATTAKPGFAIPFLYLAEAQEKRHLKKQAIKSYQRYLELLPRADDADKIRKKIDQLYKEVEKEKKQI